MKKRMSNHTCYVLVLVITLLFLSGCGKYYSETAFEDAKQRAYNEGYEDGYRRGTKEQREKDCEDFLIDGRSIRNIEEQVYNEFGITPREAFDIFDAYGYESSRSGYTWAEYQNAIDAMYYTACIFPYE